MMHVHRGLGAAGAARLGSGVALAEQGQSREVRCETSVSGAGRVTFGGVPAPEFTVVSPITLRVNVANGAVAGPISVTTVAGTGTSSQSFTPSLSINGYTPTRGPAGTVDIHGIGFTPTAIVKFSGTRAHPVTFVSPREVRTSVSAGTTTEPITITKRPGPYAA
jgi:hypothetical protein